MQNNGNYYLIEEGLYLRIYSGSRAPSLLPKYATNYVIHKEDARKLYIDGVRNFFFEQKKAIYHAVPFFVGSYKFSRVKTAAEFVKELEYFHFGEMNFHRNESEDKFVDYCIAAGVHFEYTNFWDKYEEVFWNAQKMKSLRRRFK